MCNKHNNKSAYQGKSVDLDIKNLHLAVSHFTALAFVLLIDLQVGADPLQLKGPIWIVTIIHLIQACNTQKHDKLNPHFVHTSFHTYQAVQVMLTSKLIEMVPNVVGLVIVPSVLVVNELYIAWKEKQHCLDRDMGSRHTMIMLCFPLDYSDCQGFLFHTVTFFLSCCLLSR